jgi:Uma2 family endonuclease
MRLGVALEEDCPDEYDVTQGVEVRINRRRSFIPDVLVTTDAAAARRTAKYEPHEVVLAVEIVSDGSQSMDRITKPALYAQAGIPFYWRIEIEGGLVVYTYKLDPVDEVYAETGRWTKFVDTGEPWPINLPISRLTPRHL